MMRRIVEQSLKLRFLVVVIGAAIMFFGIVQLRTMPVDVLPEFAPPYVEVQTEALGLSAAEVEDLVTVPMEELLNGVPWLETIRSQSVPGLSSIVLVFEPGTDIMRARALVQERLTQAHGLPTRSVSKPPAMLQPLSSSSRTMMIALSSDTLSSIEMSVLTRWTIRPRLMGIPGVANVAVWGNRQRQLQVQIDPERLRAHGLTVEQIIRSAGNAMWVSPLTFLNASTPGVTGGFIDTPQQRLGIRHLMPISSPDDLARVAVEGTDLRLGDVTNVVEDHQPLIGDAVVNDGNGLLLVVEKLPWANTLDVTRGVEDALSTLQPGLPGVNIDTTIFRPANFIEQAIGNLSMALLIGAALLALVLIAFLFQWRTVLISLIAIPLSLVAALFVLDLTGATINTMVLAGLLIAVGVVVDDTIIGVENITRRLREHREASSEKSTAAIVLESALEMRGPIIFATLIILLSVMPIFFMEGLSGAFFRPLATSYALAVLVSMLVALTVTPALAMFLLPKAPANRRTSPIVHWLQRGYDGVLGRTVRRPILAYLTMCILLVIGIAVMPFIGQSLLPSFKEADLLIHWSGTPGTSRPAMHRSVAQATRELRAIPGVRNVGAHVGRALQADEVVGINSGELWVSIDPAANYDATVAAIQTVVDSYPGFDRAVMTYLDERSREALTGASDAIVVRTYGPDLTVLRQQAEQVRQALAGVGGIVDLQVASQDEEPQVQIEVDLAAAEPHGLKPGDVRRAIATLLSGIEVGNLYEEQKVFEVLVVGAPEIRQNITDVRELLIDTPSGGHVRLGDVAQVRIAPSQNSFHREGESRYIDVSANVQGRDLASVSRDVNSRLQGFQFPLEYHAELLGEYAEQQAAQGRLLGFAIAALIGIFLLLQAAFNSWRLAAAYFLTLPAALVGGLVAAFLDSGILSLGALVGFFTVLGIAARNGILLINHYQHLELHEGEVFGPEMALRGALERLGPILMTTLATGLALAPLAIFGNLPGHEIVYPMTVVILGGLVTSTLLNLFAVPALYLRFGASPQPEPALQLAMGGAGD
jgi:CzcA family heavy metal efflux pump